VNGPKDQATIDRAVAIGAKITIDSVLEVGLIRRAALVLGQTAVVRPRIRPDLTSLTEPSDWLEGEVPVAKVAQIYKAGIPREDLLAMGPELLGADGVEVSGAHVHVGRHRPEPDYWRHVIREIVEFLSEVREAWGGWAPREIDIGGGLPVPRDPFGRGIERVANRPARAAPVEEFATVITASLREQLRKHEFPVEGVRLEVEPGRALYGDAGVHLATVRGMKQQSRPFPWTWVETDTTENFLPDAIFEHNRWSVLVANRADAEPSMRGDLVGCSCNPDRIVPEAELPPVEPGDIVAILDTGAYQDTLASNFNLLLRPPTVLVTGDRSELIKRRETFRDLFDRDIVPERLRRVHEPIESEAPAGASARAD
jgi:diaminopimelate decarboxylase